MSWVKLPLNYFDKEGIITNVSLTAKGMYLSLLALACKQDQGGKISATEGMGYTNIQLGHLVNCPGKGAAGQLSRLLKQLREVGLIEVNERRMIFIKEWQKFRSDYERQKEWRAKSQNKEPHIPRTVPVIEKEDVEKEVAQILSEGLVNQQEERPVIDYHKELIKKTEVPFNVDRMAPDEPDPKRKYKDPMEMEEEEEVEPKPLAPSVTLSNFIRLYSDRYKAMYKEIPTISSSELNAARNIMSKGGIKDYKRIINAFVSGKDKYSKTLENLDKAINRIKGAK